ncbi:MAG: abortive infection family protein [Candidatus Dormibacteraeota bacterium]|jgi:hypothetical protein|nr:abortive infection family protein [Candidatus Dormibacteraeota bacterium]
MPVVSTRIRAAVRELLVEWTLGTIGDLFESEGFKADPQHVPKVNGQRRSYVEKFYAAIDWTDWDQVRRYLRVVERVRDECTEPESLRRLDTMLRRDGFEIDGRGVIGLRQMVLTEEVVRGLPPESAIPGHLERMWASVEERPEQAISAAKDAIEATAKHALAVLGVALSGRERFPDLIQLVQKGLKLHPATVAPTQEGADAIKKVLGGLANIALGVDDLRNLYGDGHGRPTRQLRLTPRHSGLAARCADAYVRMLLETLEDPGAPWRRQGSTATAHHSGSSSVSDKHRFSDTD